MCIFTLLPPHSANSSPNWKWVKGRNFALGHQQQLVNANRTECGRWTRSEISSLECRVDSSWCRQTESLAQAHDVAGIGSLSRRSGPTPKIHLMLRRTVARLLRAVQHRLRRKVVVSRRRARPVARKQQHPQQHHPRNCLDLQRHSLVHQLQRPRGVAPRP